ncbi:hypothetical protein HK098_003564 [Nowakowskiella sp. JEL0407]|nr:hypothetical protein HK098_003564 [Nowakowskiella sp. JEL0407]
MEIDFTTLSLKKRKWFNLEGLVQRAKCDLKKSADCFCISFEELGAGSFKHVYRVTFCDQSSYALALANRKEDDFSPDAWISEIATMRYIKNSNNYPTVPIPTVHSYDATYANPAGTPYMIMDVVPGRVLDKQEFHKLSIDQQLLVTKRLAEIKVALCSPVKEYFQIGSITFKHPSQQHEDDNNFTIGPLLSFQLSIDDGYVIEKSGPYDSLQELWSDLLHRASRFAIENFTELESNEIRLVGENGSPQLFKELSLLLASMVPQFCSTIPSEYTSLCIHHQDFALRNVVFDEAFNVTGVIDWSLAAVMPVILSADYPKELNSTPYEPFQHSDHSEDWDLVSFDWTNLGDAAKYPVAFKLEKESGMSVPVDFRVEVKKETKKFYLRTHFATCFLLLREKDSASIPAAESKGCNVYLDAPKYLQMHEILMDGIPKCFKFAN